MVMRMADYIKREAVINHLRECEGTPPEIGYTYPIFKAIECFVEEVPAADVAEVVRGKVTEYEADEWYGPIYHCHECGCEMMVREPVGRWEDVPIRPKLCANCGAMFDGERKDNDIQGV